MESQYLKIIIFLITIISIGFQSKKNHPEVLKCDLQIKNKNIQIGDYLDFTISIKNPSKKEQVLLKSLDGSSRQLRYPYCYFIVTNENADTLDTQFGGCSNYNPIELNDFFKLNPNEKYQFFSENHWLSNLHYYQFRNPGEYKVQFIYSTHSSNNNDFGFFSSAKIHRMNKKERKEREKCQGLLNQVPRLTLKSNIVTIKVQ